MQTEEFAAQTFSLQEMFISNEDIFMDKQSDKDFNWPQYRRLVKNSNRTIYSASRASANRGAIMRKSENPWRILNKEKKIDIVVPNTR